MAHKIDHSKGKAAFISYQAPAWHGLGKVFNQEISIEEALKESNLDFHVDKLPNIHRLGNGLEIISDSSFFTVRTDVQKVLGTRLGPDYTVYQNLQALDIVDELDMSKLDPRPGYGIWVMGLTEPVKIIGSNDSRGYNEYSLIK